MGANLLREGRVSDDITPIELTRGARFFQPSVERLSGLEAQRQRFAARSVPFRVSFLDDMLFGILPVDLVLLGAETGAGKTTLGMLFAAMSARRDLRVRYIALEAFQTEIEQRLLFQKMAQLAWQRKLRRATEFTYGAWMHGLCDDVADQVRADALSELRADIETLSTFYRGRDFGAEDIEPLMRGVAKDTDLFVFDHLHYVDLDDRDDHRAMRRVLKTLSGLVNATETPVIAIAHLRKKPATVRGKAAVVPSLDEFHGTSDIAKIATKAITLAPARDRVSADRYVANTYMSVEKDRLDGRRNYCAVIGFDRRSTTYQDRYTLGRLSPDRTKFIHLEPSERPWWATNGVCIGTPAAPSPEPQPSLPHTGA